MKSARSPAAFYGILFALNHFKWLYVRLLEYCSEKQTASAEVVVAIPHLIVYICCHTHTYYVVGYGKFKIND